jgi:hypothetical protein
MSVFTAVRQKCVGFFCQLLIGNKTIHSVSFKSSFSMRDFLFGFKIYPGL